MRLRDYLANPWNAAYLAGAARCDRTPLVYPIDLRLTALRLIIVACSMGVRVEWCEYPANR